MEQNKIDKLKQLFADGKKKVEIAKELGIARSTVHYYLDEDYKKLKLKQSVEWFKKLPLERRRTYYAKRLPYMTKYQREHYQKDEVFRNKQLARMKKKEIKNV